MVLMGKNFEVCLRRFLDDMGLVIAAREVLGWVSQGSSKIGVGRDKDSVRPD